MAISINGTISSISKFLIQNPQAFNITYSGNPTRDYERSFSSTDITKLYFATFTVTTTPTTIDVTALTDVFGNALNFATVKHIQVVNNDTTNNLTVGGGTNALFSALPALVGQSAAANSNGSCVNLTTNLTVTGTTKIIQLVAGAGSISVDVLIAGN
jgi:hypothetical protein